MSAKPHGRVPDSLIADGYVHYERMNISIPKDLHDKLKQYCDKEDRAKSWVVQQAVDSWLKGRK